MFSGFGLKPPAYGFSLIFTVASRLLHLCSTLDKISRLKMKSFSTVRDTPRGSQSYMEKRRGRKVREVTRRRRGELKRGEHILGSNQFPMCSSRSGTPSGSWSYIEKRRGRREIKVMRRRGVIEMVESMLASNHFPMCSPQSGPLRDVHGVMKRREEGGRRQRWPGG